MAAYSTGMTCNRKADIGLTWNLCPHKSESCQTDKQYEQAIALQSFKWDTEDAFVCTSSILNILEPPRPPNAVALSNEKSITRSSHFCIRTELREHVDRSHTFLHSCASVTKMTLQVQWNWSLLSMARVDKSPFVPFFKILCPLISMAIFIVRNMIFCLIRAFCTFCKLLMVI